jgi:S1-C subfamily serine protease
MLTGEMRIVSAVTDQTVDRRGENVGVVIVANNDCPSLRAVVSRGCEVQRAWRGYSGRDVRDVACPIAVSQWSVNVVKQCPFESSVLRCCWLD